MDRLLAAMSEGVGLIDCAVSCQDFQPMWSQSTNVTDGQTDRQTTCDRKTALCTKVHCAVTTLFAARKMDLRIHFKQSRLQHFGLCIAACVGYQKPANDVDQLSSAYFTNYVIVRPLSTVQYTSVASVFHCRRGLTNLIHDRRGCICSHSRLWTLVRVYFTQARTGEWVMAR